MTENAPAFRAFGEADGDIGELKDRTIAIIGYGNQGRAQALNLRDSGIERLIVATLKDDSWTQAEADGFTPRPTEEAARDADILFLLIPDEELPVAFRSQIGPHLQPNDAIVVASGYNLTYDEMTPPENIDVVMLAPRMIGRQMRQIYERGEGFYSYVSVEQDASGRAWPLVLALAKGIGTLRLGAFELSARDETILDLFAEQGFGALLGSMFFLMLDVGVKAGLPPEAMVMDMYLSGEMTETFQAMAELGFMKQARLHSPTSQYGGMMRSMALDREPMRRHLEMVMEELKNGEFARQWAAERKTDYETFKRVQGLARGADPFSPIEERIHAALRAAQAHGKSE